MPFNFNPVWVLGPYSGLIISLMFSGILLKIIQQFMEKQEARFKEMTDLLKDQLEINENRNEDILDQLLKRTE